MKNVDLKSMSADELWNLHEQVIAELGRKMTAEKAMLEDRLRKLGSADRNISPKRERRTYPKVDLNYRNPKNRREQGWFLKPPLRTTADRKESDGPAGVGRGNPER
jgi:DNA-binding protein H-NS